MFQTHGGGLVPNKGASKGGKKGFGKGPKGGGLALGAPSGGKPSYAPLKGGKKGKDGKGSISKEREEELREGVQTFIASDDSSWPLSADLTGLERKFIHQLADEHGLSSQSAGFGPDRYITLFKDTLAAESPDATEEQAPVEEVDPDTIQFSGMKIDNESRGMLMPLVDIPEGWLIKARIGLLCKGALSAPKHDRRDFRSEMDKVEETLKKMRPGQHISAKVVSIGKSETSLAVGLLLSRGVMSTQRTPHVTIAKAPEAPAMIASRSIDIQEWTPIDGPTIKGELIQHPKGANYVEPAGEAELVRKRPLEGAEATSPRKMPTLGKGKGAKGKGKGKGAPAQQTARQMAEALLQEVADDNNLDDQLEEPAKPVARTPQTPKGKGKGKGKLRSVAPKPAVAASAAPVEEDPLAALLGLETGIEETVADAAEEEVMDDFHLSLCGASPQKPAPAARAPAARLTPGPGGNKAVVLTQKPGLAGGQPKKVTLTPSPAVEEKKELSFDEELLAMLG